MAGFRTKFIQLNAKCNPLPFKWLNYFNKSAVLPVYHTVSDEEISHIKHLYAFKKIKEFEQDLDFLLKNYSPISLQDFLSNKKTKKNPFLLTFDDGLVEFYHIIAPILEKKGIPAVNFLNSAFVDNKDLMFRYKQSLIFDAFLKLNEAKQNQFLSKHSFQNKETYKRHLFQLKFNDSLKHFSDDLELNFNNYLLTHKPYLDSFQINELINKGFEFGAHSINHPEFQFITLEEQVNQTISSLDFVKNSFNINYDSFAFPFTDFGVKMEYFNTIEELFNQEIEVSKLAFFGAAGKKIDSCSFNYQRIPMEMGSLSAKQILKGEFMYFGFKQLFNKNRIDRNA